MDDGAMDCVVVLVLEALVLVVEGVVEVDVVEVVVRVSVRSVVVVAMSVLVWMVRLESVGSVGSTIVSVGMNVSVGSLLKMENRCVSLAIAIGGSGERTW